MIFPGESIGHGIYGKADAHQVVCQSGTMGFTCGQQRVIPASVLSLLSDDNYFVAFLGVTIGKEDAAKIGKWAEHHLNHNQKRNYYFLKGN